MESGSDHTISTITTNYTTSPSPTSSATPLAAAVDHRRRQSPPLVVSPCAACKILRRRCVQNCVLAPYFPPTDPLKFTTAHRVFGASNIIKFLQELPEAQRADAVSSMVYEANARLRDPVYGCAGAICQLQKQVNELQEQLAKSQAQVVNLQCKNANLMTLFCMEMPQYSPLQTLAPNDGDQYYYFDNKFANSPRSFRSNTSFEDEENNIFALMLEQPL